MKDTQKLESNPIRQYDDFDLMDYLLPLAAKWKLLLVVMLLGSIVGFASSRLLPRVYQSSGTIFVQSSSPFGATLSDLPISLGSGSSDSSDYLLVLLGSDSFAQSIIAKLDLAKNPGFARGGHTDSEDVLKEFRKRISIQQGKNGNISIVAKANDPELAARIANEMLNHLGKVALTRSDRRKDYTARKLEETSRKLDTAQGEMQEFLENNKITSVDDEAKSAVAQLTELESKSMGITSDIESLRSQLANAGNLDNLVENEVQLRTLESSKAYIDSKIAEVQKKIEKLPAVAAKYARIQRDIATLSKTYEILTEQYQLASITREGEDGDYQIIDRARPEYKSIAPKAGMNTIFGGLGFLVLTVFILNIQLAIKNHKPRCERFTVSDKDIEKSVETAKRS